MRDDVRKSRDRSRNELHDGRMNPARLPDRLALDRFPTPLGVALLVTDEGGRLRALDWEDHEPRMERLLRIHYGPTVPLRAGFAPDPLRDALGAYFEGDIGRLDAIACATAGTPCQRGVWSALRRICAAGSPAQARPAV